MCTWPPYQRPPCSSKQRWPGSRTAAAREGAGTEATREAVGAGKDFFVVAGSAKNTVREEPLRRFDSSFRYLHGKALGHF